MIIYVIKIYYQYSPVSGGYMIIYVIKIYYQYSPVSGGCVQLSLD